MIIKPLPEKMAICSKCHLPFICLRHERIKADCGPPQIGCSCEPCHGGCETRALTQDEVETYFELKPRKGKLIGGVPIQ